MREIDALGHGDIFYGSKRNHIDGANSWMAALVAVHVYI